MKYRNGFVSNSSSSSFVVAFDKIPETVEEMREFLFKDADKFMHPYDGTVYHAAFVANTVFRDMKAPATVPEVVEELDSGWLEGFEYDYSDIEKDWELEQKRHREYAAKIANIFIAQNPDKAFLIFKYSDQDGSYGNALEHGDLFSNLPHLCVSKH